MPYTVKWVEENLGVTRDTLRYYEEKGLMPANQDGKYRIYDEKDINRIWGIKYLRRIGFSTSEIVDFETNPNIDFYEVLGNQIEKLEKQKEELDIDINFAKTIKATGNVPSVKNTGNMTFQDFFKTVRTEWNFGEHIHAIESSQKLSNIDANTLSDKDIDAIAQMYEKMGGDMIIKTSTISTYFSTICEFYHLGKSSEVVQTIVGLLFRFFKDEILGFEPSPERFAKNLTSMFLEGDIALSMAEGLGEERYNFLIEAIAYFGGYATKEDLYNAE